MKSSYTCADAVELFASVGKPWWVAGGWALDLFLGEQTRPHDDLDLVVLRHDIDAFRDHLEGWDLWVGLGNDQLEDHPLTPKSPFSAHREVLWCRPSPAAPWAFELLLTPSDKGDWIFKRDPAIRRPISEIGGVSPDGVPYLRPEIILLFKANNLRDKDQTDAATVLPRLDAPATQWLRTALEHVHPGHEWLNDL